MKKAITFLLVVCLCAGLCACAGNSNDNHNDSAKKPTQFENTLIENLKIGDPQSRADELFGKVTSYEQVSMYHFYEYTSVTIFGESYTPKVISKNGKVYSYGYHLISSSTSVKKVAYRNLVNHFTSLYGEPFETKDGTTKWYFADGGYLQLTEDTHDKNIFYCKD